MSNSEIQDVLRNCIERAHSPLGQLPPGTDPSDWIAKQFANWWKEQAAEYLTDAQSSSSAIRAELHRLDDSGDHDEALHELTHLEDALSDLAATLGLQR